MNNVLDLFNGDSLEAGYYRTRLAKGARFVGVRIWYGPPADPETGEILDRSWRWQCEVEGEEFPLDRVWPYCSRYPSDEAEYRHLTALKAWGVEHMPDSPEANPYRKATDLLSEPSLF